MKDTLSIGITLKPLLPNINWQSGSCQRGFCIFVAICYARGGFAALVVETLVCSFVRFIGFRLFKERKSKAQKKFEYSRKYFHRSFHPSERFQSLYSLGISSVQSIVKARHWPLRVASCGSLRTNGTAASLDGALRKYGSLCCSTRFRKSPCSCDVLW